jgi:Phosphatidylinositol-4-phosphate 5-Kinase
MYDLKGSLHRRITKKIKHERTVRKDLNFLTDTETVVKFSSIQKSEFKKRLYADKEFLKSCNLMDYSLLLIVFKRKPIEDSVNSSRSGLRRGPSPPKNPTVMRSLDAFNLKKIKEHDSLCGSKEDSYISKLKSEVEKPGTNPLTKETEKRVNFNQIVEDNEANPSSTHFFTRPLK